MIGLRARCVIALAIPLLLDGCDKRETAFACPDPGTVYTLSMPLAMSSAPRFRTRVLILGGEGYDCHLLSETHGEYWLRAGLVNRDSAKAWVAAAEDLWPLHPGKTTHAHFAGDNGIEWSIDYRVAAYKKFTARVGTFDAYEIIGTLSGNGKQYWTTTLWWAPDLRYALSYRYERADGKGNTYWEIAALGPQPALASR